MSDEPPDYWRKATGSLWAAVIFFLVVLALVTFLIRSIFE